MLHNGNSNRSRGSKSSKKSGDLWPPGTRQPCLKKFDGAARSCTGWDHLRKDSELWLGHGDCFIHLYEKGQSQRGPAFKILFASLLATQCQPLIERFVDRSVSEEEAYQNGRVDLYIPARAGASRSQAAQYHLTIRNLFAWVTRRSVVGDHLGNALIGLTNAMEELREPDADNIQDLLNYLDEEGYLDMRNQPDHALGLLHVAEVMQMDELYLDAFAHCVGMSEHLYKHSEYSRISIASRKLIRRARVDMDFRLSRAGAMLGDLLDEELSEAHLGLSAGARAHLDRFRAYMRNFYATRFGNFPPPPADSKCSTIYRPDVYRSMKADFDALYHYLVDKAFTTTDNAPSVAQGGLCALQSVHEFDLRHKFTPLDHPLPLFPAPIKMKESRRRRSMPWFMGGVRGSREGKLRPDQRLGAHAALMRATNHTDISLLDNALVMAYREFEERSIMTPPKGAELGVSPGDARKVRWLFIYAMYQTLRSCADTPAGIRYTSNVNYHLGISTQGLPPWQDRIRTSASFGGQGTSSARPGLPERGRSIGAVPLLSPIVLLSQDSSEIKPDIDYFALTHQEARETPLYGRGAKGEGGLNSLPRSRSQSSTRNMSLRRSLSIFRHSAQKSAPASSNSSPPSRNGRKSLYHEIIVHGYGNGTNSVVDVSAENPTTRSSPPLTVKTTGLTASRSASTSSNSSFSSSAVSASSSTAAPSLLSTTPTTLGEPHTPTTSSRQTSDIWKSTNTLVPLDAEAIEKVDGEKPATAVVCTLPRQKSIRIRYSNDDMLHDAAPPPLPRRSSKRYMRGGASVTTKPAAGSVASTAPPNKRWSMLDVSASLRENDSESESEDELQPVPLRIRKASDADADVFRESDEWERRVQTANDVSPPCAWEQYADLGGLRTVSLLS
ncbi:unnamed protein product [Discula destructiva]